MTGSNNIPGMPTPDGRPTSFPQAGSVSGTARLLIAENGGTFNCTVTQALAAAGSAPEDATYFVLSSDADIPNARTLRFTSDQFSVVDNGAGLTSSPSSLNFTGAATPLVDNATAVVGTSIIPAHSDHQHPINVLGLGPVSGRRPRHAGIPADLRALGPQPRRPAGFRGGHGVRRRHPRRRPEAPRGRGRPFPPG